MVKILSLLLFLGAYFSLFVFGRWYAHIPAQIALLLLFLTLEALRHGLRSIPHTLRTVAPFVLTLLLFGCIFQWMELMGRTDWLHDSLLKSLVFPNSFLAVKAVLAAITFRDLTRLTLPAHIRRALIVLRAVMDKSAPVLERHRFFMNLSPHFRHRRMQRFLRICAVMVAAYISIYRQTEQTALLYDHRQRHLRRTRKEK